MKTVWKYTLNPGTRQIVIMPRGSRVLTAGNTDEELVLWAEVFTHAPEENRCFESIWTGDRVPDMSKYIGTVVLNRKSGYYVYHLYEIDITVPAIQT